MEMIERCNETINGMVWGAPMLVLLVATGVWMTARTGFFQIARLGHWWSRTVGSIFSDARVTEHTGDSSISQFQSLCTALASTVGTGNIVGVAGAVTAGGPGAVFWMWVIAFFSMMTEYAENVLGIYYRRKNEKGEWTGGAMYYLRDGLGAKRGCRQIGSILAGLFALFCFMASFGIGNMTQANAIAANLASGFGIPHGLTGVVLMALAGLVILGGLKRIAAVTEKLVPFMVVVYMVGTAMIFLLNIHMAGEIFSSIFHGAFGLRAAGGGFLGAGMRKAIVMGMKRGVFSNEAGLGSSVMVHARANVKEPVQQGMWGIFEVFADTMAVCTLTAFAILSSGLVDLETGAIAGGLQPASLVSTAFGLSFGSFGARFVATAVMLFAFSTILGWSHYGATACEYLFGRDAVGVYRVAFIAAVCAGALMSENLSWEIADTLNGLMALPNLIGLLALSGTVAAITENYERRVFKGSGEAPMLSAVSEGEQKPAVQKP